jgi:hypothetical protein
MTSNTTKDLINKGTGAGGAKTTLNGLSFEEKTSIEPKLTEYKYEKKEIKIKKRKGVYYEYKEDNINIIYFKKNAFKLYFEKMFKIETYRQPDEAYLIKNSDNNYTLKILEKKNQNVEGSVEDKLKTGAFNRREYELMLNQTSDSNNKFNIIYTFCVSKFLQEKLESNNIKYKNMLKIMKEDNIDVIYGDEDDYLDKLCDWIKKVM